MIFFAMAIILLTSLWFIRSNADLFYFNPTSCDNYVPLNGKIINHGNHLALYKNGKDITKVMIVSHGNAGVCLYRSHLFDKLKSYDGDIYIYEYPGFMNIGGIADIDSCTKELNYWINYLKPKYKIMDLYGESIGGGIIVETCKRYNIRNINTVYLQSTFSSITDVVYNISKPIGILHKLLLSDHLNTIDNLDYVNAKSFLIIHSKTDEMIDYDHAIKNYNKLVELNKKVTMIDATGEHNTTVFEL